jgi:hypothetical protein
MPNIKERILNELIIQEGIEGKSESIDIVRKVVPLLTTQMELNTLIKIKFHRYGTGMYAKHRFYYPSKLLLNLINLNNNGNI